MKKRRFSQRKETDRKDSMSKQKLPTVIINPIAKLNFSKYSIIDNLENLGSGVKVIEEGSTKTGDLLKEISSSKINLAQEHSIRMTKNDYNELVRNGSLSRSQELEMATNISKITEGKNNSKIGKFDFNNTIDNNISRITAGDDYLSNSKIKIVQSLEDSIDSSIKPYTERTLELLISEDNPAHYLPRKVTSKVDKLARTELDDFHYTIIQTKQWGNNTAGKRYLPPIKNYRKVLGNKGKTMHSAIELLEKNPRDRVPKTTTLRAIRRNQMPNLQSYSVGNLTKF